jgi:hypothetical protein
VSAHETSSEQISLSKSGNAISGDTTTAESDSTTRTTTSTDTIQGITLSSSEGDNVSKTISGTDNSITGSFSLTETDTTSSAGDQSESGAAGTGFSVSAHESSSNLASRTLTGNDIAGSTTNTASSGGARTITSAETNQGETISTTQTDSGGGSLVETDNSVTGAFSLTESGNDSSTIDQSDATQSATTTSHKSSNEGGSTTETGNEITGADTTTTTATNSNSAAPATTPLGVIVATMVGSALGYVDYAGPFWESLGKGMGEELKDSGEWQVHHIYQQGNGALEDFLKELKPVNGKTGVFDVHGVDNLAAVPKFIHDEIGLQQDQFWRLKYNELRAADPNVGKYSIQTVIGATKGIDAKKQLLADYEQFVGGIDKQYGKYFIRKDATLTELNGVAKELGHNPAKTIKAANAAIVGQKSAATFAKGTAARSLEVSKAMTTPAKSKNLAGKAVKALSIISLLLVAKNVQAAQDSQELIDLVTAYQAALSYEFKHGYPDSKLIVETLLKLRAFVDYIGASNDAFDLIYDAYLKQALAAENG